MPSATQSETSFREHTTVTDAAVTDIRDVEECIGDLTRIEELDRGLEADFQPPDSVTVWGVPLSRLTLEQTLYLADLRIQSRRPGYFITANLNYAMLSRKSPELQRINNEAAFVLADGMPMVWYARKLGKPIPERIAGSELIYSLTEWAAQREYRVFFLGGGSGVAEEAATRLQDQYPSLQVCGIEVPPFRPLSQEEDDALVERIRAAKPDILYVALGQPRGEIWMAERCQRLGVPCCVQLGASFDFVIGRVKRAPIWVRRVGAEWLYRISREPRRLGPRYFKNLTFLAGALLRDVVTRKSTK